MKVFFGRQANQSNQNWLVIYYRGKPHNSPALCKRYLWCLNHQLNIYYSWCWQSLNCPESAHQLLTSALSTLFTCARMLLGQRNFCFLCKIRSHIPLRFHTDSFRQLLVADGRRSQEGNGSSAWINSFSSHPSVAFVSSLKATGKTSSRSAAAQRRPGRRSHSIQAKRWLNRRKDLVSDYAMSSGQMRTWIRETRRKRSRQQKTAAAISLRSTINNLRRAKEFVWKNWKSS